MDVPRVPADASGDDVEAALRNAGCVVVEQLVEADVGGGIEPETHPFGAGTAAGGDGVERDLDPFVAATAVGADEFTGLNPRRTGALLARSVGFRGLAAHP